MIASTGQTAAEATYPLRKEKLGHPQPLTNPGFPFRTGQRCRTPHPDEVGWQSEPEGEMEWSLGADHCALSSCRAPPRLLRPSTSRLAHAPHHAWEEDTMALHRTTVKVVVEVVLFKVPHSRIMLFCQRPAPFVQHGPQSSCHPGIRRVSMGSTSDQSTCWQIPDQEFSARCIRSTPSHDSFVR